MSRNIIGLTVFILLALCLLAGPVKAIDVAVPSDFPYYDLENYDPSNQGYYFSVRWVYTPWPTTQQAYAFIMDQDGNVVWYYTDPEATRFFPHYSDGRVMLIARDAGNVHVTLIIFNEDFTVDRIIPRWNPFHDNMRMDVHEAVFGPNGNLYTLWYEAEDVDMSQVVPGGDPNCIVDHAAIQEWDDDGNLVWEWRSIEHLDELPYTAHTSPIQLLSNRFQHLHANSIDVEDDGDLVVNALSINYTFRIDRATGNIEWGIGGDLDQFTYTTSIPDIGDTPLHFIPAHDAQLHPGNVLSIFDNGLGHDPPRSYGRVYTLDLDNMVADLTWVYGHPDEFCGPNQGSFRLVEDGKSLVGWGGIQGNLRPTKNATEVAENGDIVWQIRMYDNADGTGPVPDTYRWYKMYEPPVAAEPYLSEVSDANAETIELIANWFGHENEVAGYDIYVGYAEDNLFYIDTTWDGIHLLENVDLLDSYYCQAQPVDANGDPVGPMSNLVKVNVGITALLMTNTTPTIPASGGNLTYNVEFYSIEDEPMNLRYRTKAQLPGGSFTPFLFMHNFFMPANSSLSVNGVTQYVPPEAPAGLYTYYGTIYSMDGETIASDDITFRKLAGAVDSNGPVDWSMTRPGTGWPVAASDADKLAAAPELAKVAVAPNPFNPSTTVTVTLAEASELQVTVYDLLGRQVAVLARGQHTPGEHRLTFDASNLASGLYFVRTSIPGELEHVHKVMLVR